tara:strand:+ start:1794 stop:2561 length:768 start_codon:yes stop_codon:yes gene_type:complete
LTGSKGGDEDESAKKKVQDKLLAATSDGNNVKQQKQQWMDLILSKEFDLVLMEVFVKCSGINEEQDSTEEPSLDVAELAVAIDSLYSRLEKMMGGGKKLPRIKEKTNAILAKYDDNTDGKLDAREWEGFARTYFSRMEWPVWKTAARGAVKGVGAFVVVQTAVQPLAGAAIGVALPVVMKIVKEQMSKLPKAHMDAMKAKVFGKLKIGKDADGDGMPDEVEVILRKKRMEKRIKKVKTIGTYSAGFAAGAVAGIV